MNRVVLDTPAIPESPASQPRPYLGILEQEAFRRTNHHHLYHAAADATRHINPSARPESFVVHVPFSPEEHQMVEEYLTLSHFFHIRYPIPALPTMLTTPRRDISPYAIHRDDLSVLEYFNDQLRNRSTLPNGDDCVIQLQRKNRNFPVLSQSKSCTGIEVSDWYRRIGIKKDTIEVVHANGLCRSLIILFVADAPPVVVSIADSAGRTSSDSFSPRFLVNTRLMLTAGGFPVYCCDHQRYLLLVQNKVFTFFDLLRPARFELNDSQDQKHSVPSIKSVSFEAHDEVTFVTCCTVAHQVLVAGVTSLGLDAWRYDTQNQSFHHCRMILNEIPYRMFWIGDCQIVVVEKECFAVKILSNPFGSERQTVREISLEEPAMWIECKGEAMVLQFTTSHNIKVIRRDSLEERLIDFTEKIECAVLCRETLIVATTNRDPPAIVIWDLNHPKHPHGIIVSGLVNFIQPISTFDSDVPVFLIADELDVAFIDAYGQMSDSIGIGPQMFYHSSGYFAFKVRTRGLLDIHWFSIPPSQTHES
jgi:hypothetical protein